MDSLQQFDTSKLNDLLQNPTATLIPESLITTIKTGFIALTILGVLFLILYVITTIRKWKVDSAILQMQKDIAVIKSQGISKPKSVENSTTESEQTNL